MLQPLLSRAQRWSHPLGPSTSGRSGLGLAAAPSRPLRQRRPVQLLRAKRDDPVRDAVDAGNKLADAVTELVPDSVPRGAAKGGVVLVGGLLVWTIVSKVLSGLLTVLLLGGGAFLWFKASASSSDSGGGGSGGGRGDSSDDGDDALAEARRIMDKYK